jgi:drug/metabolite transporter (DMT)-like permease
LSFPAIIDSTDSSAPLASILLPLASAFGYVAAVLLVKRSSVYGVGLWRTAFISNVAMGVCFAPLWLLGGAEPGWWMLGQAALCAALFFTGQVFTFAALAGDVSLATPVLGLKIIFVAGASALLVAEPVRPAWWIAAALGTAAVALLQAPSRAGAPIVPMGGQGAGRTVALAAGAALAFAFCDVLVQRFTPAWGPGRFLPVMFGLVGVFSLGLVPVFAAPLRTIPRAAWVWLLPGAVLLAMQAAGMAFTLGTHGRATAANILYSTRGLWSVLAVGLLGAWLGTAGERKLPPEVFRRRLWGAGLMMAAVALVLG